MRKFIRLPLSIALGALALVASVVASGHAETLPHTRGAPSPQTDAYLCSSSSAAACTMPWAIIGNPALCPPIDYWGLAPDELFIGHVADFGTTGNFGALALYGNGALDYKEAIVTTCGTGTAGACDQVDPEVPVGAALQCEVKTGSLGLLTDDALTQRYYPPIGAGTACDATTYVQAVTMAETELCRDRAVFMPIIEAWPPAGQSGPVHVLDLATFYIAGWDRSAPYGDVDVNGDTVNDDAMIWGYFLEFATADSTTFTVNNTADPGDGVCDATECTLREAIDAANGNPGTDTIAFNIPGEGPHTIRPTLPLSDIFDPVIIDGYTQPGASPNTNGPELGTNAVLKVELDGSNAGDSGWGLRIIQGSTTVRGLAINRYFLGAGIFIDDEDGNIIEGNFIGTDVSGTAALGNGVGVVIETSFNTIGGTTPQARNVISGSNGDGIYMYFGGGNVVEGNLIGLDATGTAGLPNSQFGVSVYTSTNNVIGGTTPQARNVISMNIGAGVDLGNGGNHNLVQGNYIGTDVTGMATPSYDPDFGAQFGVLLEDASDNTIGGTTAGAGNVISGKNGDGIGILRSHATGNRVEGNFIGPDAAGSAGLGNLSNGVDLFVQAAGNTIGGTASGAGNVIAYNGDNGVRVYGANTAANTIRGNSIHSNFGKAIDNESGGNTELAPPVITGFGSVMGTACPNCTVDVYSDDEDEGRVCEGSTSADGAGNWTLHGALQGPNVTATATDAAGNTSELSAPVPTPPPAVGGTIELRSDGLGTARLPDESGSSVPYAPLAAALATGTISVAVACWYAKRRWLRR